MNFKLSLLSLALTPALLCAQSGPGWVIGERSINADKARMLSAGVTPIVNQSAPPAVFLSAPIQSFSAGQTQSNSSPVPNTGNIADEITPEIEQLARGLLNDPVRIYEYCKNNIRYEHYFGCKKGAHLTLLEGSGNSFDTSALMVALLRASGFTAGYRYAPLQVSDGQMSQWLGLWYFGDDGVPFPDLTDSEFRAFYELESDSRSTLDLRFIFHYILYSLDRGYPVIQPRDNLGFSWNIPHVAVVFIDENIQVRVLDPSVKILNAPNDPVDLLTATGFSKSAFLSSVSTGSTEGAGYIQNLNETELSNELTSRTTALTQWLKSNRPNESTETILGRRTELNIPYNSYSDIILSQFSSDVAWLAPTDWTEIPTQWITTLKITAGEYNYTTEQFTSTRFTDTFFFPELQGKKLSLSFNGNTGTFNLDDTLLVAGASFSVPNSDLDIEFFVNHPHGDVDLDTGAFTDTSFHDQAEVKPYEKADDYAYAFIYGFNPSGRLLRERQEILDSYIRDPNVPDNSNEVVSEILNIMGLNWMLQTQYNDEYVADLYEHSQMNHHKFGRMGQEEAFYIDVGLITTGIYPYNGDAQAQAKTFQLQSLLDSALEHSVIEQMQGADKAATSTIKILQLANEQDLRVYRATPSNWGNSGSGVRSHLSAQGYSSAELDAIEDYITSKAANVLLPENPIVALDQWAGTGYAVASGRSADMIISGDLFGGFLSAPDTVEYQPIFDFSYSESSYFDTGSSGLIFANDPLTTPSYYGADPVDMVSGAFVYDKMDLQLGQGVPRGLVFSRHYNSNRRFDDSRGLGFGWTHNLDIYVTERSSIKAGLGQSNQYQMAPYLAALIAAKELYDGNTSAKEWQSACLAIDWSAKQLSYKTVAVTMGIRTLEYVELPDGTYAAPAGVTMTLSKDGSNQYVLSERHGNTYSFNSDNRIASITDQHGLVKNFIYTNDKLTQVTDGYGRTLTLTWSGEKITRVADGTGRDVDFTYTGDDLTSVSDPDNHSWTFAYDTEHRITELRDPKNQIIVQNTYDAKSRVATQLSEGDSNKTWNFYWSGFCNTEENPEGGQVCYFYDERGRSISIENALGEADERTYDGQDHMVIYRTPNFEFSNQEFDGDNNLVRFTDALSNETVRVYDSQNRRINEGDFKGNDMEYTYNAQHQVLTVTDRQGILVQTNTYDSLGRLKTVTDAASNTTTYGYDSNGYRNRIDYPDTTFETFTYNTRGDMLSRTNRRNNTTSFTYNKRRQLLVTTFPDTSTRTNVYDSCGNLLSETDNEGNTTSYTYSSTKKRLTTTLPTTTAGTGTITNTYDTRDWLATTTDPLTHEIDFTYDAAGRIVTTTDPLDRDVTQTFDENGRVLTTTNPENETTAFAYDARGLRETLTDALSRDITYSYDDNGNQTGIQSRRSQDFTYTFDNNNRQVSLETPLGNTTSQTWNNRGLLATIVEPSNQTATLTYDSMGRLQTQVDPVGTITFGYDDNGNPTTITEGSTTITRVYDSRNRVTSYTDALGNTVGYQYDDNGNLTVLTYPDSKTVTYAYDARNQLISVTDWNSRVTSYTYDLNGRLTGIARPNGTSRTIVYDAAGQITRLEERKADGRLLNLQDFAYDNAGRITREFIAPIPQPFSIPTNNVTYDNDNRIATFNSLTVTHDVDGNMTSGPLMANSLETYAYDARNRLTSVGGLTYQYDAEGNRIRQTDVNGNTDYAMEPNTGLSRVLVRTKPDGSKTFYVYGIGLQYEVDESENTLTYHYDYRGSTRMLTADDGQTITDRFEYSPYGTNTFRVGTTDTPFQFNGMFGVMTEANGLLQMRARYFNPYLMRFLNQDPIGFDGGMNWYAYADGNPINYIDPTGLIRWGALGRATIGLVGNGLGMLASAALAVAPEPTMATKVGAVALAGKSSYGIGVNAQNFVAALRDNDPVSTGALTNDIAQLLAPGNQTAQNIATGVDIGTDLAAAGVSITHALSRIPAGQRSASSLLHYEIGQKTLSDEAFKVWGAIDDPVARGAAMVDDMGWLRALTPSPSGATLGIGSTFSTGPTPLSQAGASFFGALGGIGNQAYNVIK